MSTVAESRSRGNDFWVCMFSFVARREDSDRFFSLLTSKEDADRDASTAAQGEFASAAPEVEEGQQHEEARDQPHADMAASGFAISEGDRQLLLAPILTSQDQLWAHGISEARLLLAYVA